MEPIDAAVIPFPSDETTPPVTKTYFGNLDLPGVFQMLLVAGLQEEDLCLALARAGVLDEELALRSCLGNRHLLEEGLDPVQLELEPGKPVVHRHHPAR